MRWIYLVAFLVAFLVAAPSRLLAETYRHDAFGVAFRVPADFSGDPTVARSDARVLSAWSGTIGSAFALLVIERVDTARSGTANNTAAKAIVERSLINAHCDALDREQVRWHARKLGVIVCFVKGDDDREVHAVVDVPLVEGGALRIRLSTAAAQHKRLSRILRSLVASVVVRKPSQ